MRSAWLIKNLEEVLEIQNGYAFDSKGFNPTEGLPLVRIRSLKTGTENETMFSGDYDEKYIVNDGDLLIGMDGEFGCYEWRGSKALLNQRVCRLQGFKADLLLPRFLFYGVNTYLKAIEDVTGFATVKHISSKQILGIKFPLPPISEQQRIVAILDQAFEGIAKTRANAEQNQQNARALFESHLQSVFTHRSEGLAESTLDKVCDLITCGVAATPKYVDESVGVPFLSAQNVRNGEVVLDKFRHISKNFHQELTKKNKPAKGDILYSRVGSKFGEAGVVEHDFEFSVYVSLTLIKPKPEVLNSYFLKHYLNSAFVKSIALKSISSSGVPNLNVKDVRQFPIKLPSLSQQLKLVEEINLLRLETHRLEAIYQRKIALLDELKKSLLQQAFAGEL